jgi:hypothetical protein
MQDSNIPVKIPVPFASSATGADVRAVAATSQIGVNPGWASFPDGFVPLNFLPVSAGGVPPFGQDVNGILLQITQWVRWLTAGAPLAWDSTFSAAIGGYPKGATVASATTFGLSWMSTADNNTTNPDTGGSGWVAVGGSASPYAVDTGSPGAMVITPTLAIEAYAAGQLFFVNPANANPGGATTIAISGMAPVAVVDGAGAALRANVIVPGRIMALLNNGAAIQWVNAPISVTQAPGDNSTSNATTAYADASAAAAAAAISSGGLFVWQQQGT